MGIKNPLIFVVEDNEFYNDLIVTHLNKQKFTNVKSFFTGEECLKDLAQKPDIIIQDYNLPGMNGIEVLKRVKKIHHDTEFIFLSAQESLDVATDTIRYGAYDYVVKDGVVFDKVIFKIKKIITNKKLARQNLILKASMLIFFIVVFILVIAVFILRSKGLI